MSTTKFILVLTGIILLIGGLVAYATIPNVHTVPVQSNTNIVQDKDIHVSSYSSSQTPENVTVATGKTNQLEVNLTVSLDTGSLSSTQFKLFTNDKFQDCMLDSQPSACLYDRPVSNSTLVIPLNASTVYYFGFDNSSSNSSKHVVLSASLHTTSMRSYIARDGGWNAGSLGLSAIGLIVMLYGVASRTVIPWE